jgi:sugar lactone lactonase YvrE
VAAWHNSRVNRIDQDTSTMTWWAGTGGMFFRDGDRQQAIFARPSSIVVTSDGTIYVSDSWNHVLRRIDLDGIVTTIAGEPRVPGYDGDGGHPNEAHLHTPTGRTSDPSSRMVLDGDDLLYVADTQNGVIRTVDLGPCITDPEPDDTLVPPNSTGCEIRHFAGRYSSAGTMTDTDAITGVTSVHDAGSITGYSGDGGNADLAVFNRPSDVAVGRSGEVYVLDAGNNCVRVIRPDHVIETFAGRCTESGYEGDEGPATEALLAWPSGVAVGPDGNVYIADSGNQIIRRVVVP